MRGEDTHGSSGVPLPPWITPACAGKTTDSESFTFLGEDHPRMRGEDSSHTVPATLAAGSPPHARGRQGDDVLAHFVFRITPACAGKTLIHFFAHGVLKDHPRMRGEDGVFMKRIGGIVGSPPHARGRLHERQGGFQGAGITPACAGKTF